MERARDHIVAQSYDAHGNVMDMAHTNLILDTRMNQVEFAGGKVAELTANIIAESIYAQCDADWNEYLLLDLLIDYCKEKSQFSSYISRLVYGAGQ